MIGKRLLMIPGPIEFTPEVLAEMAKPTLSHTDPQFIEEFGQALEKMRKVWLAPNGQPFIIAGSGTLAMESAAVNITEPRRQCAYLAQVISANAWRTSSNSTVPMSILSKARSAIFRK